MKSTLQIVLVVLLGALFCPAALAEDAQSSDEDTIVVIAVGATPEDIVNIIELPPRASSTARERATANGNNANDATEFASEFGKEIAEDAKSKNVAERIRDDLHENAREVRGDSRRGAPDR